MIQSVAELAIIVVLWLIAGPLAWWLLTDRQPAERPQTPQPRLRRTGQPASAAPAAPPDDGDVYFVVLLHRETREWWALIYDRRHTYLARQTVAKWLADAECNFGPTEAAAMLRAIRQQTGE